MFIKFTGDTGILIAPIMGTFWFRGPTHLYMIKAPWNELLFSERYGYQKVTRFMGWRFWRRVKPNYGDMT